METYATRFSDDDLARLRQLVGGEWLCKSPATLLVPTGAPLRRSWSARRTAHSR